MIGNELLAKACVANGKSAGEAAIAYKVSYQQPRTPEEDVKIRIAQLGHENDMLRMERDLQNMGRNRKEAGLSQGSRAISTGQSKMGQKNVVMTECNECKF